jgi:protein involved in polysaccharide export with SLBB domain
MQKSAQRGAPAHERMALARWAVVALTLVAALLAGRPASAQGDRRLQPGDELIVVIPEAEGLVERTVVVDEEGEISLGFYGRASVAGVSLEEAQIIVRGQLREYIRNTQGVIVSLSRRQLLVLVTGQVEEPGLITIGESADLWMAIQEAGGVLAGADLRRVVLMRGNEETIVDVRGFLGRSGAELPDLRPGDTIFVPAEPGAPVAGTAGGSFLSLEALDGKVFIMGAVLSPGLYDWSPELNGYTALSLAGGPTPAADLGAVRLITRDRTEVLNLVTSPDTGIRDLRVIPNVGGAILYVPERVIDAMNPFSSAVSVIGGVTSPGRIPVAGPMPLLEVLAAAGGPTVDAEIDEIRHVRQTRGYSMAMEYDLERYLEEGGALGAVLVYPGDTLFVPGPEEDAWEVAIGAISDVAIIASAVALFVTIQDGLRE